MKRTVVALLLSLPFVAALLAFVLHTPIVQQATRSALDKVGQRLGEEVHVERIEVQGLAGVRLHRLRIGPRDAVKIEVRAMSTRLDLEALGDGEVQPKLVEANGVTVHLRGDGSLRGLAESAREWLPPGIARRLEARRTDTDPNPRDGVGRALPELILGRVRVIDHAGALEMVDGALTLTDGRLNGKADFREPGLGHCTLDGSLNAVDIECESPFGRDLPAGLRVAGKRIELIRKPRPAIRLPGISLGASNTEGGVGAVLGGLSAELRLELARNAYGRFPIEARLVLPGGGQIVGRGGVDRTRLTLSAQVADLEFGRAHEAIGGAVGGRYDLDVDLVDLKGTLEGEGRTTGLTVEHPMLADGPVGPFDLSLQGKMAVEVRNRATRAAEITISDVRVDIDRVGFDFEAFVDTTPDAWKVQARFDTGKMLATDLGLAIPKGLLPNLQPMKGRGQLQVSAKLDVDKTRLKETVFDIDVDTRRLKITEMNRRVDFEALRDVFTTRFEMPPEEGEEQGEILTRESGPNSDRWVPFELLPPLLAHAVTAQEDGGFYRHRGISMLHLRDSLILNLETGRFARGGSTITMQLARNLFLNRRKTLARKLEELILTWLLEKEFTKDELMTLYLNVVEFGPDIFGVGEASAHYFGRPPIALTPPQMAWLVRLLPNPRAQYYMFEDKKLSKGMTRGINWLLRRLVTREHLAPEDLVQINRTELFDPEANPMPTLPPGAVPGVPGLVPTLPPDLVPPVPAPGGPR